MININQIFNKKVQRFALLKQKAIKTFHNNF
jgi:hypothetical protein